MEFGPAGPAGAVEADRAALATRAGWPDGRFLVFDISGLILLGGWFWGWFSGADPGLALGWFFGWFSLWLRGGC